MYLQFVFKKVELFQRYSYYIKVSNILEKNQNRNQFHLMENLNDY